MSSNRTADPQAAFPQTTRGGISYGSLLVVLGLVVIAVFGEAASSRSRGRRRLRAQAYRQIRTHVARGSASARSYRFSVATGDHNRRTFWENGQAPHRSYSYSAVRVSNSRLWPAARRSRRVRIATSRNLSRMRELKSVRDLRFDPRYGSDDDLKYLKNSKDLQSIWLSGRMTGKGLRHLAALRKLRRVNFGSGVTVEGLETLKLLPALKEVSFCQGRLDSAAINVLQGLSLESLKMYQVVIKAGGTNRRWPANLKDLQLINCPWVTDKDLLAMTQSTRLESLVLHDTGVTSTGIEDVANHCPQLKRLWLSSASRINNSCMSELSKLTNLEEVVFLLGSLSDGGFRRFWSGNAHSRLRNLHLIRTRVTTSEIASFEAYRAHCRIHY